MDGMWVCQWLLNLEKSQIHQLSRTGGSIGSQPHQGGQGSGLSTRLLPACQDLAARTPGCSVGSLEKLFQGTKEPLDWMAGCVRVVGEPFHCRVVSRGLCSGATVQLSLLSLYPTSFLFVIEHMMPLCMVISWVYSVAMMIQHIVTEKEHRLKEVGMVGEIPGEELVSPSPVLHPWAPSLCPWAVPRPHIAGLS